jgi:opacity protein-like surface antigen
MLLDDNLVDSDMRGIKRDSREVRRETMMRKVLALTVTAAIILGTGTVAPVYGKVPAKKSPKHASYEPYNESHHKPAKACPPSNALRSGFFGGLKGGYAWINGQLKHDGQATAQGPVTSSQRTDMVSDGGEIGVFLGYDHYYSHEGLVGFEAGAQWRNVSGETITFINAPAVNAAVNTKLRLQSDWSFDFAIRLGHKVYEKSLWYVKAGVQISRFSMSAQNTQTNTLTGLSNTSAPTANKNRNRSGVLGGLGVEIPVNNHISVGAEYNFTWYQNLTVSKLSSDGNGDFINARLRPYENSLVARVLWRI